MLVVARIFSAEMSYSVFDGCSVTGELSPDAIKPPPSKNDLTRVFGDYIPQISSQVPLPIKCKLVVSCDKGVAVRRMRTYDLALVVPDPIAFIILLNDL